MELGRTFFNTKTKLQIIIILALSVSLLSGYTAFYRYHSLTESPFVETLTALPQKPAPSSTSGKPEEKETSAREEPKTSQMTIVAPPALDIKKAKTAQDTKALLPRNILFTFVHYRAKTVLLAGDFNEWKPQNMQKEKLGVWRTKVAILPGTYRYSFMANGKKYADPYNPKREKNASILIVEPRR